GTTRDGKGRITNGRLDEVSGFDRDGNIVLKNGKVVDRDFGHLDLGYVITSHASQGKDRKLAIAAMGSSSLPAINAKQFYVTVSRGSEDVAIFVDDKAKVRRNIERSGNQLSATELSAHSETDKGSELSSQRESTADWVRQGQRAVLSFRDRLKHWFQGMNREQSSETVDRHREHGTNVFGLGSNSGMQHRGI
ncbi:MAG: relaxase, partial [Planctomycetota bacterium]